MNQSYNQIGNQFSGFNGVQSIMQPGFAGTHAQQVRQDINRDLQQGSYTNLQSGFGQQASGMMSGGGYGGVQSIMQPGYTGTDAQQVRQDISRDLRQGNMMYQQGGFGQTAGMMSGVGYGGGQSIMQPGFAGTDAQQVRQDISRDLQQGSLMYQQGGFGQAGGMMSGVGYGGGQSIMQPGFAGTDAQQVRQDINRDLRQGSMMYQQGGFGQAGGMMSGVGYGGGQSIMQPGFAGTDAQQVRQDISRDLRQGSMMNQQGGFGQQAGGMSGVGYGGGQSIMQPGFAGSDAQQVRQDISRDLQQGSMSRQGGFGQQAGGIVAGGSVGGVQSITQSGFAGTDAQQVRQDISRDLQQGSMMNQQGRIGQQAGGMMSGGGVQSITQPGFAGTDAQQVRQDISRDLQQGTMKNQQAGFGQQAGGMMVGGGVQSITQPGFAGTDVQQVRQDISRDSQQGTSPNLLQ